MATSTSRRISPRRAARAKPARLKTRPRAAKSAQPKTAGTRRRGAPRHSATGAAAAVLKSFAKLLGSVRASAAHLTAEQRTKLQKAMKRAHAALD